ncbi:hypothetical protein BKA70DRAFT_1279057 [Coprinopsis sp. MPI-PUGE-AT-0042]|nr:hypothetical protein BKA70DRAFT_1279057 [Coprinopsis sp. MPI-PUGE-AT-0042]
MPSTSQINPRIIPFTHNNDPLPPKLKPVLEANLDALRKCVSACELVIGEIEEGIASRERQIREIGQEIEDLRIDLRHQREAKDEHITAIRTLESTGSVVRRVPPEIVASIIRHSIFKGRESFNERHLRNASAVSKLWRATALSTPSFWRFRSIRLGHLSNGRTRDQARLLLNNTLNLWYSRSGDDAGIELWFSRGQSRDETLLVCDVVDWILSSRFRISSLYFWDLGLSLSDLQLLLSTNPTSLRQMKELYADLRPVWPSTSQPTARLDLGPTLPSLDSLTLAANPYSVTGSLPALFFHPTLTKLTLADVTLHAGELLNILRGLPSLRILELQNGGLADEEEIGSQVPSPLTHPSLREIVLYHQIFNFFDDLTCPALEKLDLDPDPINDVATTEDLDSNHAQALGSFLHHCQPLNLTLCLGAQFPSTFLNALFQTSGTAIKTLHLRLSMCVTLDIGDDGVRLAIPSSVVSIQSPESMSKEDFSTWISKFSMCLEDSSSQTLTVKFGNEIRYISEV